MTTPLAHAHIYTDFQGLSELRGRARDNTQENLREVAGQFEALFLQMMLKSMRDANLGEGLMDSDHVKTFQSMFDQQIAMDLAGGKGLGLAEMMVRQLSNTIEQGSRDGPDEAPAASGPAHALRRRSVSATGESSVSNDSGASVQGSPVQREWAVDTPEDFVRALLPHARRAAAQLGTRAEVLISQAALETGWGQHMIRTADGDTSFNLFGIKADARWQGERAVTETVEFRDGLMRRERASFRAYDSLADGFADYVAFIKGNARYHEALTQAADPRAYTRALSEAGYATDPQYPEKIDRILDSRRLRDALSDNEVM